MTLGLSIFDLLVIYAIPLLALVFAWLIVSMALYLVIRMPARLASKDDLLRKYEDKRSLPSGPRRLTFRYVAMLVAADNCVQATLLYRLSRFFALRRVHVLAGAVHAFSKFLTHVDISPYADIGPGVYFFHGVGTVIGKGTVIGSRALICQGVTTGAGPSIGDDVRLWAGAKVIGKISVGDRAEIGANAVVIRDVPADSTAVGVPARVVVKRQGLDGDGTEGVANWGHTPVDAAERT
jgi:serine O-acetyltransferase